MLRFEKPSTPENSRSEGGSLDTLLGCVLIAPLVLVVAAFILFLLIFSFLALLVADPKPGWEKTALPAKITYSSLLFSHAEHALLEGCVFAAYRLRPEMARAIDKQGIRFFSDIGQPPGLHSNLFAPWKNTPVPEEPYIFAGGALAECSDDTARRLFGGIDFRNEKG